MHQLNNTNKIQLILASQSPRRRKLLIELFPEVIVAPDRNIDENYSNKLSKIEIPQFLAQKKAHGYIDLINSNTILITADTIVWHKNEVLGKPKNESGAIDMLKRLSGAKHEVISGVCIKDLKREVVFYSKTDVWFDNLSDEEINFYVNKFKPFDKAGAYGIQEWIGYIGIEKISGSYFNVVGLPIHKVYSELKKFL